MWVLGLESSCDETAAAVVNECGVVRSDVVRTQVALHAPYGGVVPEIAARDHLRAVLPVVEQALAQAGLALADVDGVAVTCRPGLMGALLVGIQAAKGLAWAARKPLLGVDHLVAHLLSVFLQYPAPPATPEAVAFPFIGLLVSGGHTALYHCRAPSPEGIAELGATRDDAAGEAYDKVAKLLGLGYPGGPLIDRLAAGGERARAPALLRSPMAQRDSLEFSFSGLKSAVARHVAGPKAPKNRQEVADLCAEFQYLVVETLVHKAVHAATSLQVPRVVLAGGVAANRGLRTRLQAAATAHGFSAFLPPLRACTDNGAMVAYAGALRLARGEKDDYHLGPATRTLLPRVTRKGRGKR